MNKKKDIEKKSFYVYNLPQDLLNTLILRQDAFERYEALPQDIDTVKANLVTQPDYAIGAQACSLCNVKFSNVEEQRNHAKSDLHCYNIKQKSHGTKLVTEQEFEELIGNLSESISGSDLSDFDEIEEKNESRMTSLSNLMKKQATLSVESASSDQENSKANIRALEKTPLIYFTSPSLPENTQVGIYRCIFTNEEQNCLSTILDSLKRKQIPSQCEVRNLKNPGHTLQSHDQPHFFLCMIGGGHFAGMILSLIPKQNHVTKAGALSREINILVHKTFHRYTTRRKQGGAQSSNDAAKGAAHSAGANLRRYNEQALMEEVRLLLQDWKDMIRNSELLFIRATGSTSRRTLFGPYENQILTPRDPRIRGFPFNTRRATKNELLRSFIELTQAKFIKINESKITVEPESKLQLSNKNTDVKPEKKSSIASNDVTQKEATLLLHTSQIQALIKRNRLPALLTYLKTNNLTPEFQFCPSNSAQNYHASTPLHLAAHINSVPLVIGLLLRGGASPEIRNHNGKTPYEIAGERATRQAFRIARFELGEEKWNWNQTGIPCGISRDKVEAESRREKEEEDRKEKQRKKSEVEKLELNSPTPPNDRPILGKAALKGRMAILGQLQKTPQERREDEAKGLTPEMRMRLDRERRARAAEERMKKMAYGA